MRKHLTRRGRGLAAISALALVTLLAGTWQPAVAASPLTQTAPPFKQADPDPAASATLGATAQTAAGSCWEIKQQRPDAADGVYWLLTPALPEPTRYYCDQTTDGGGWVLVAKGRNAWTSDYDGRNAGPALLTPEFNGGADVHQLPSTEIDQLLNGGRVDALDDGVRLRRATNSNGSSWQEDRFKLARRDRWVWSFDAKHPLASYTLGTTSRSGGTSDSFGTDNSYLRVVTTSRQVTGWNYGFGYGPSVRGYSARDSYLYSPSDSGNALPFTLVYLRPKVSSTSGFATIPDSGTTVITQPAQAASLADSLHWGVSEPVVAKAWEGDVEVQSFTQSGDRMYVGGNFRYVTADNGTHYEQSFLAAFDVETGEWVPSFRPELNGSVRALATLPDGRVVAGGMFTEANGQPVTSIVALDPVTGDTAANWSLTIENRVTGGVVTVRSLRVVGDDLYLAGSFTHLQGTYQRGAGFMRNLGRIGVRYAAADGTWNPNLNGTVAAIDPAPDGSRIYAAGYFTRSKTVAVRRAAAILTAGTADLATPAWTPTWSSTNDYQQAVGVSADGESVWVGGSEHSLFQFSTATFDRRSTTIFDRNGDVQAVHVAGGLMYAGCHCNANSYTDAVKWPLDSTPWSQGDTVHWVGAFDPATGARVPGFTPTMKLRSGAGIWAITTDSNGRLWIGGDILTASSSRDARDPSGGFARYSPRDVTAPSRPTGLRVASQTSTETRLAWDASSDDGAVRYQILREDRPIATTTSTSITLDHAQPGRYFVRAADDAGNISASTPVLEVHGVEDLIPANAVWQWRYEPTAPSADWMQPSFDDSAWQQGDAVLGWGSASIATDIDTFATTKERPLAAYFRRTVDIDDLDDVTSVRLRVVADDGAAVYVNGVEVARKNLPEGALTHGSYAIAAPRSAAAQADPIVVDVPRALLHQGANTLAVETHLNYRGTPDITFALHAIVTSGG